MREYLRVLVHPCALGLPPAYADIYAEAPVVLEASVEIPTTVAEVKLASGGGSLLSTPPLAQTAFSTTAADDARVRPLGSHGQTVLTPPLSASSAAALGTDVAVPTGANSSAAPADRATSSRLRAGLDRLRIGHRTRSPSSALRAQPVNTPSLTRATRTDAGTCHSHALVTAASTRTTGLVVSSTALTHPRVVEAQLHYVSASLLCELEHRGLPLPARLAAGLARASSTSLAATASQSLVPGVPDSTTHYTSSLAVLTSGVRACTVYPLEEGRYMATLLIPPRVWQLFGPALIALIVGTALKGYDVSGPVAAASTAPIYFPLDARLKENAEAVQAAVQSRLEEIARAVVLAQTPAHTTRRAPVSAAITSTATADVVLRRLTSARPSTLQCGGEVVRAVMGRLVREAITQQSSSRGRSGRTGRGGDVMASAALKDVEARRFVVAGCGVWWEGLPVYSSAGQSPSFATEPAESVSAWYDDQLLPAALVVTMAHLARQGQAERQQAGITEDPTGSSSSSSSIAAAVAAQRPTERLLASFSPHQDALLRGGRHHVSGGFVDVSVARPEHTLRAPSSLCVCVAAQSGWTVVVRLEPSAVPFVGQPLEGIVVGVRELCRLHFAAPAFQTFIKAHSPAVALQTARTVSEARSGGGGGGLRQAFGRFALALPQRRAVAVYSAASVGLLSLVRAMQVRVRCVGHGLGVAFSISALAALQGDTSLFDWQEDARSGGRGDEAREDGEERHTGCGLVDAHTAALVSAALSLTPLSRRSFAKRASQRGGGGMACGPHSLFALTQPSSLSSSSAASKNAAMLDTVTVFHAVKTKGASRRRANEAVASTSTILYVVLALGRSDYMAHTKGDSRTLLGLTTWLLNKAYA